MQKVIDIFQNLVSEPFSLNSQAKCSAKHLSQVNEIKNKKKILHRALRNLVPTKCGFQ